ncbi:MAG: phosphoribosylglycinamide formyltransferase [Planctomycetota bacterium]
MTGSSKHLRLGVLASGGGRTLENLVELSRSGGLLGEVVQVITNRRDAYALERAVRHGIPSGCVRPADYESEEAFGRAIGERLEEARVDLALLAGYLVRLPLPREWRGRVMNIHPALLPAFGGKGFYGHHVHEAVLAAGAKITGCTVHFVDDEYDHGPIIVQRAVPVRFEDSADDVAARVFEEEKVAYPEAINLYAEGRLKIHGGRVMVLP